jgi:hypothetical protein
MHTTFLQNKYHWRISFIEFGEQLLYFNVATFSCMYFGMQTIWCLDNVRVDRNTSHEPPEANRLKL